ncbi:MAG: hypothetical protein ABW215_17795 [Kibdelosporangium sp.]
MTREEGPERTQRTVAELLAKYGANSDEGAPRRRRRRAEDAEDTAPQAIIDRVMSDSGSIPRIRDEDPPPGQPPPAPPRPAPAPAPAPSRHRPAPQPSQQLPQPSQQMPLPPAQPPQPPQVSQPTQRQLPPVAPPERRVPRPAPQASQPIARPPQSSQWPTPPVEPGGLAARLDGRQEAPPSPQQAPPPELPQRMPMEGVTEQMPRIPDEPPPAPGARTGQHPAPHRVARTARAPQPPPPPAYPQHEPDEADNYPTEYHGFDPVGEDTQFAQPVDLDDDYEPAAARSGPISVANARPIGHEDDDYDEDVDEDDDERGSPVKEWLSMAGQLAIGVIGGAALWLGFNWLWGKLPAAALIVALAVIVGLVWVVRKIRRADDLQTTILTVLVGLVVTVSPAAMLLLNR